LINSQVAFMAAEQVAHNHAKSRATEVLTRALKETSIPGEVFIAGLMVPVDPYTVYEPDALVRLGAPLSSDSMTVTDPIMRAATMIR
jgi:hypothetical protein